LEKRKIFVSTKIRTPDHSSGGTVSILPKLPQPQKFLPRTDHESPALATLPTGKKPCPHCRGGWVGPSTSPDKYRTSNAHTQIQTLGEKTHTPKVEGWVCPRSGLDILEKINGLYQDLNLRPSS